MRSTLIARRSLARVFLASLFLALASGGFVHEAVAATSLGNGAWSYFGDPRAVHREGKTYVGWVTSDGRVQVSRYVHATRAKRTVTLRDLGADDHNNPSVVVLPDGRVRAFYSPHRPTLPAGEPSRLYYRTTTSPANFGSWTRTRTVPTNTPGDLGYAYPNPLQFGRDTTYLFWRGGDWNPAFSISRDDGRTWSRARTLVDGPGDERPYAKYAGDGRDTWHVAYTEGHPAAHRTSLYYLRYRGGRFRRADGSAVGSMSSLPLGYSRGDKVYDVRSGHGRAWVLDIAQDHLNRPMIVYQRRESDDVYRYARWTGRRWVDHRIVSSRDSRSDYYTGGATLDHEDPSVVYASRRIAGVREVQVSATADGGRTWAHRPITKNSSTNNVRPVSPRGLVTGSLVLFMRGSYVSWREYSTSIVAQTKLEAREKAGKAG